MNVFDAYNLLSVYDQIIQQGIGVVLHVTEVGYLAAGVFVLFLETPSFRKSAPPKGE